MNMMEICRKYCLHDETGVLLSGGETQSLVISRALYQNSPVFIFDELSSALDPIAEYNLNQTVMRMETNKMIILISHRLSTTKMADRIYMLEDGQIAEQGTREKLMEQEAVSPFYPPRQTGLKAIHKAVGCS